MECMELRTLGNLVRARLELGKVTAGWDAAPEERTAREARRANRDWRAFVSECLDTVEAVGLAPEGRVWPGARGPRERTRQERTLLCYLSPTSSTGGCVMHVHTHNVPEEHVAVAWYTVSQ